MQRPRTNLKTQGIQSSERHTCSGHNAQTNDYFTTQNMIKQSLFLIAFTEMKIQFKLPENANNWLKQIIC